MIIREASVEDYVSIAEIIRECLGYSCEDQVVRRKLSQIDKEREIVFVAELEDKVVGYIHGDKFELLYMDSLINVLCLAVDENYRHNGIGSALLNQIEVWAKDRGAVGIRLNSASAYCKRFVWRNKGRAPFNIKAYFNISLWRWRIFIKNRS